MLEGVDAAIGLWVNWAPHLPGILLDDSGDSLVSCADYLPPFFTGPRTQKALEASYSSILMDARQAQWHLCAYCCSLGEETC